MRLSKIVVVLSGFILLESCARELLHAARKRNSNGNYSLKTKHGLQQGNASKVCALQCRRTLTNLSRNHN